MAAKQHLVVCVMCGRQFDANRGGYYNSRTHRYTCKTCGVGPVAQPAAARSSVPNPVTAKSLLSPMIGKCIIAGLILFGGLVFLAYGGWFFTLLALAGAVALALTGIIPYVKRKKLEDRMKAEILAAQEEKRNRQKTCPKCGATTKGQVCEFCGSPLED